MAHSDLHACSRGGGGVRTGAMRLVLLLVLLASPALSRAEALGDVDKDLYDYAASGSLDGCTRSLEAGANPDGYTDADNVGGTACHVWRVRACVCAVHMACTPRQGHSACARFD